MKGAATRPGPLPTGRYSYLLGIYLGDGHIAPVRRSFRLSIACDARYAQVNHAIEASVGAVSAGRVSRYRRPDGCLILSAAWRHWPCVFPQHGRGRKHDRQIRLEAWQQQVVDAHPEAFLRGLIHSDGSRVVNKVKKRVAGSSKEYRYLRYFFSNRSSDIRTLFCDTCDRLGLRWRADGPHNITINHQSDIAFVDTFVGPKA